MQTRGQLYLATGLFVIFWTALVLLSYFHDIQSLRDFTLSLARQEAITTFQKDQAIRHWSTAKGGVYVEQSEITPPNPYLSHIADRDVITGGGKSLTLMNPAYMLREIMAQYEDMYGPRGHITSLKTMNPGNKPDSWETTVLQTFEESDVEEVVEVVEGENGASLRLMRPMMTQEACLKCHGKQGYKVGDVRGGVSVTLALSPYFASEQKAAAIHRRWSLLIWLAGLFLLGCFALWTQRNIAVRSRQREELLTINRDLQAALSEIKTLRGIIPICSYCKKVRDDDGLWNQIEVYLNTYSDAEFSHGMCPECYQKELEKLEKEDKQSGAL